MLAVVLPSPDAGTHSSELLVAEAGAQGCSHKAGLLPKVAAVVEEHWVSSKTLRKAEGQV